MRARKKYERATRVATKRAKRTIFVRLAGMEYQCETFFSEGIEGRSVARLENGVVSPLRKRFKMSVNALWAECGAFVSANS